MLTPSQLKDHRFERLEDGSGVGGDVYDAGEVERYLGEVTASYEQMFKENGELVRKITLLANKVEEYRQDENIIRDAMLNAQKTADLLLRQARGEVDYLLRQAREEANVCLSRAHEEAGAIIGAADDTAARIIENAHIETENIVSGRGGIITKAEEAAARVIEAAELRARQISQETEELLAAVNDEAVEILSQANSEAQALLEKANADSESMIIQTAAKAEEQSRQAIDEAKRKLENIYASVSVDMPGSGQGAFSFSEFEDADENDSEQTPDIEVFDENLISSDDVYNEDDPFDLFDVDEDLGDDTITDGIVTEVEATDYHYLEGGGEYSYDGRVIDEDEDGGFDSYDDESDGSSVKSDLEIYADSKPSEPFEIHFDDDNFRSFDDFSDYDSNVSSVISDKVNKIVEGKNEAVNESYGRRNESPEINFSMFENDAEKSGKRPSGISAPEGGPDNEEEEDYGNFSIKNLFGKKKKQ